MNGPELRQNDELHLLHKFCTARSTFVKWTVYGLTRELTRAGAENVQENDPSPSRGNLLKEKETAKKVRVTAQRNGK